VLLWGLIADAASMAVLLVSSLVMQQPSLGLPLLMVATGTTIALVAGVLLVPVLMAAIGLG
jgi:hypothetical protein